MGGRAWGGLTGNQLKLIAAFAMVLDHAGILLFPKVGLLRILGRLAFPIFAYMIAEGCRYTRHKWRYFLMVFGLGVVCQGVYLLAGGDWYLNILLTFSLSILLIYCARAAYEKQTFGYNVLLAVSFAAVYGLPCLVTIDYGFWGIVTPVLVSLAHMRKWPRWAEMLLLGAGLLLLGAELGGSQPYSLLALPILFAYSGRRGKHTMKYFFYIFYPLHLVVLEGISMLLQ